MTTQEQIIFLPPTPVHRPIPFVRQIEQAQRHSEEFASAEPEMFAASAKGGQKGSKVSVLHFLNKRDKRV